LAKPRQAYIQNMIKFSRAGWNNIIIFGVMGFILLINATHDNVFSSKQNSESEQHIFNSNSVILTLSINQQVKVERIGKTWRMTPGVLNGQALEQMMLAWHQSIGSKVDAPEDIDPQLGLIVSAELAGQAQAIVLSLYVHAQQLLIYNHQTKLWLSLPLPIYEQLLPEQLFAS